MQITKSCVIDDGFISINITSSPSGHYSTNVRKIKNVGKNSPSPRLTRVVNDLPYDVLVLPYFTPFYILMQSDLKPIQQYTAQKFDVSPSEEDNIDNHNNGGVPKIEAN